MLKLVDGIDFYTNKDGKLVFTEAYHLKRGHCCKNKCLHCPWHYVGEPEELTKPK